MRSLSAADRTGLALALAVSLGLGAAMPASYAADPAAEQGRTAEKEGGLRVEDLPKPVPSIMKTIQGIGNRVGKEISEATSKGAKAVKGAVTKDQTKGDPSRESRR